MNNFVDFALMYSVLVFALILSLCWDFLSVFSEYLHLLCQHQSYDVWTETGERQITRHISDLLNNEKDFIYEITDYRVATASIMVDPVCWVGLLSDWIMIRWAAIRYR